MARRKRASYLTTKQASTPAMRRKRLLVISLVSIPCILLLLTGIGYLFLVSWLQSDSFREKLSQVIQNVSHAQKVVIPQNMDVDGGNLTLPELSISGAREVEEFSLRKLHLEVDRSVLLRRILRFNQFSTEEMRLTLSLGQNDAKKGSSSRPTTGASTKSATSRPTPSAARADSNKIPVPVANRGGFLKAVQARSFESLYSDTSISFGKRTLALKGYRLTAKPRPDIGKDSWNFLIENGRLIIPFSWLRNIGVQNASILLSRDAIKLSSCKILLTPGDIRLRGTYSLKTGNWSARMDVQRANVARILNEEWKKKLTGSLEGYLNFSGDGGADLTAQGEVSLLNGVLQGLPVLSSLKMDGALPYLSVPINKASCKLRFPYSDPQHNITRAWLFDEIDVRATNGLLLCRGRVVIGQEGSLSGTLDLGLPSKVMASLGLRQSDPLSQLFNTLPDLPGWIWLRINLSGTIDDPHEDLSVRLATLFSQSVSSMSESAAQSVHSVLNSFVPQNLLPSPAGGTKPPAPEDEDDDVNIDTKQKPWNTVKGVIDSGLKMLP